MKDLQTPRLTLRPCTPDDRDDFMALERDPAVMRFLNGGHPVDHGSVLQNSTFLMPRGTESYVWTGRQLDGTFVGWFCLWPESAVQAELGYRLSRSAWGQGFASEGASALVAWGFEQAGYETVVATTMTVNTASRRVMEKIGMDYDRTVHEESPDPIPGIEEGEVWYVMTRAAWDAR